LDSGEIISPSGELGPLVVIANYVFDGVPHDAFAVRGGRIFDCLLSLHSDRAGAETADGEPLDHFECEWSERPAEAARYDHPLWNEILEQYTRKLDNVSFLFPTSALSCVERLRRLCEGSFMLLCTDKADHHLAYVGSGDDPEIEVHGSAS